MQKLSWLERWAIKRSILKKAVHWNVSHRSENWMTERTLKRTAEEVMDAFEAINSAGVASDTPEDVREAP
jgi:hypothetical protein